MAGRGAASRLWGLGLAVVLTAGACSSSDEPTASSADTEAATTVALASDTPSTAEPSTRGAYPTAIGDAELDNPAFDDLEQQVTHALDATGLPGASLLVVQGGELVEEEAWGTYDLDTVVPIASASKWLTAATMMSLVDDGTLELDAPISDVVDQVSGTPVGRVTLRQLLSFTSGLVADERIPCTSSGAGDLQACATAIVQQGVVHPPGEQFRYGSQHLYVAAALAEVATGQPFVDLFEERIAGPLGMDQTGFAQVGQGVSDVVTHPNPAGGAYSSLGDYGRFLEMISHRGLAPDGTRLLSEDAIAEMQTNQTSGALFAVGSAFRKANEAPYGLGEWIDWTDEDGDALVLSSDGKFGFRPWIDKTNDLFGVYLIEDHGSGYSEGDPDASAADERKVHTSGLWVLEGTAEALDGSLPETYYADR